MIPDRQTALPSTSFLPFNARQLARARTVYLNPGLTSEHAASITDRFAFMIPDAGPVAPAYTNTTGLFDAERYGGRSIGVHGGGVRCGNTSGLSVKGIGCNPLAGMGAPEDYSNGGLSLADALQETLCGEVLNIALPYGAVRTVAVIHTDAPCWWVEKRWGREALRGRYGDDVYIPRGLLVREMAVRPAHFERALFYRPSGHGWGREADVERVESATRRLPGLLPQERTVANARDPERLGEGLREFARRLARQSAAAKLKRIVHGNICSSNICLDGRWIDFGSVSALPNWGEMAGYGSFWRDESSYDEVLALVHAAAEKFVPDLGRDFPGFEDLSDLYRSILTAEIDRRFVDLTGVSHDAFHRYAHASELLKSMKAAASAGHRIPFDLGHPTADSPFGALRLAGILAAVADDLAMPTARLGGNGYDRLAASVSTLYAGLIEDDRVTSPPSETSRILRRLRVAKLQSDLEIMYKPVMVERFEQLVRHHRDPEDLAAATAAVFETSVSEAVYRYADATEASTWLGVLDGMRLAYDASADALVFAADDGAPGRRIARRSAEAQDLIRRLTPMSGSDQRSAILFGDGPDV